ncbi:MAG: fused MFS/spermidine synthase [bacterium]|nr:fused MFS/spermidine synthase [bacterium]
MFPQTFIILIFLVSGLTGLIYEITWSRLLQEVFGSTNYSITAILSAFMGGLGLGAVFFGRAAERQERPLRMYAGLELATGITALLTLPAFLAVKWLYLSIYHFVPGQALGALIRFALVIPVVGIPAALMGGTLPVMSRLVTLQEDKGRRWVSLLYGLNTLGATIGVVLTGFIFLEVLGIRHTIFLAVVMNLVIGTLAWIQDRKHPELSRPRVPSVSINPSLPDSGPPRAARSQPDPPSPDGSVKPGFVFAALAVAATGFITMQLEIVTTRVFIPLVGGSTYAFSLMLILFLLGIGGGGIFQARWARRRIPTVENYLSVILILLLAVAGIIAAIPFLTPVLARLISINLLDFWEITMMEGVLVGILILPAAFLLGIAFPMAIGIGGRGTRRVALEVGQLYLFNTLGSIAGSVLTGFILVPRIGSQAATVSSAILIFLLVALGLLWTPKTGQARRLGWAVAIGLLAGILIKQADSWTERLCDQGIGIRRNAFLEVSNPVDLWRELHQSATPLRFLREGLNATVSIREDQTGYFLKTNGKIDASSWSDMSTQLLSGLIPRAALSYPPENVLVIGLGSGVTAGGLARRPEVKKLDVVEIEPAVVEAADFFAPLNHDVLRNPKVRIILEDARTCILASRTRYDLIISEPSNPWIAGISHLYTEDFFREARKHLSPEGIYVQWIQLYSINSQAIKIIFNTFRQVFPYVEIWSPGSGDIILLGCRQPITFNPERAQEWIDDDPIAGKVLFYLLGLDTAEDLAGRYLGDQTVISSLVPGFENIINTDDRLLLEFLLPRQLYQTNSGSFLEDFLRFRLEHDLWVPAPDSLSGKIREIIASAYRTFPENRHLLESKFQEILRADRPAPPVLIAEAEALLLNGQTEPARQILEKMPGDIHPSRRDRVAFLRARIALGGNDYDQVVLQARALRDRFPAYASLLLAKAANGRKNGPEAVGFLEDFFRQASSGLFLDVEEVSEAISELTKTAENGGEWKKAVRILEQDMPIPRMRLLALMTAAKLGYDHGDLPDCARVLKKVEEYSVLNEELSLMQVQCFQATGDSEHLSRAKSNLKFLNANKPDHLIN